MKYRIIKHVSFDGTSYSIERQLPNDTLWIYVPHTVSSELPEAEQRFAFILEHGEPKDEVLREVTV